MIRIGDKQYRTSRPKDLDAAVQAATGLSAAEMARQLAGHPRAQAAAQALRPFLGDDAPGSLPELAAEIALADMGEVQAQVLALYQDAGQEPLPLDDGAGE